MVAAATVLQIADDFGHGISREVGEKKEEREGIRFHALPAAEMHRRDRISQGKRRRRVCSSSVPFLSCTSVHGGSAQDKDVQGRRWARPGGCCWPGGARVQGWHDSMRGAAAATAAGGGSVREARHRRKSDGGGCRAGRRAALGRGVMQGSSAGRVGAGGGGRDGGASCRRCDAAGGRPAGCAGMRGAAAVQQGRRG
jgi:hypothetical protein